METEAVQITGKQVAVIWGFVFAVHLFFGGMGIATPIILLLALYQTAPYFLSFTL